MIRSLRLTTREVCALGRFSRATLWRRVRSGALPPPIDHGREALFDAAAVERALTVAPVPRSPPNAAASRLAALERRWLARQPTRRNISA